MDSIYSNKKYLQTLNAADYYRNPAMRPSGNEYACGSYQNTMSRRSLFGIYSHQPNMSTSKYSYPSDVSLSSHYGYTSWGLWREPGHLSASIYSKRRINIRSFSILIMSAAFIVLLAVLSVAALAFYFSTFKSDPVDSTLVFDCNFRIVRGDVYTSGLKYNHTAIYRQKAAFYTKFIETSLEHGSFNVAKTEIYGFGTGPEIHPNFRLYLDMRRIQMTITNVEEHIKNAFISETGRAESSFRNLKIDDGSIEIKRQMDPEVLRQASLLYRDQNYENSQPPSTSNSFPTTVIPLDDLAVSSTSSKKQPSSSTEKTKSKLSTVTSNLTISKQQNTSSNSGSGKKKDNNQKPIHESDVDMENLPVIQGSFEITKTDADIAQKRSNANQRPASTQSSVTSTLKPFFITPASTIRIKSHEKPSAKTSVKSADVTKATTTPASTTTTTTMRNAELQQKTSTVPTGIAKIEKTNKVAVESFQHDFSTSSPILKTLQNTFNDNIDDKELPKLDVSLFTSAPVLDEQPWRPIQPVPSQMKSSSFPNQITTTESTMPSDNEDNIFESPADSLDIFRSPFKSNSPENVMFRNKFADPVNDTNDSSVFYQSFYNPNFSAGDLAIEKLGIDTLRPYPLPVNKIDLNENQNSPQFKPLGEKREGEEIKRNGSNSNNDNRNDIKINYDEEKFEHLGGGVIAKKPETNESKVVGNVNDAHGSVPFVVINNEGANENMMKNVTESTANLSDIFQELLDLEGADDALNFTMTDNNKLESRIISDDSIEDISSSTEQQIVTSPSTTTTSAEKLNFMNMKEFIVQMQRNKSSDEVENSSEMENDDDDEDGGGVDTIFGGNDGKAKTTEKSTTTYVEVETLKYTPTSAPITHSTVSSPQLFPDIVHKWEFVNGTSTNSTESSITKKIFNETLQAVVVENSQTTSPSSSSFSHSQKTKIDDFQANRTGDEKPANLQELSSIFDTLVSKLGMKPIDTASKTPPFSQQNSKLKNGANSRNRTTTKKMNSKSSNTTPISKQRPTTNKFSSQTKAFATTTQVPLTTKLSTYRKSTTTMSSITSHQMTTTKEKLFTSPGSSSEIGVIGEAEVEPVDPTQYDEMLSLATSSTFSRFPSTTTPSLITLLPAKSNSGIRNFNPRLKLAPRTSSSSGERIELPKNFVVKTSMTFDA